jgi:hypothetical protein
MPLCGSAVSNVSGPTAVQYVASLPVGLVTGAGNSRSHRQQLRLCLFDAKYSRNNQRPVSHYHAVAVETLVAAEHMQAAAAEDMRTETDGVAAERPVMREVHRYWK